MNKNGYHENCGSVCWCQSSRRKDMMKSVRTCTCNEDLRKNNDARLRQEVEVSRGQFGFMLGKEQQTLRQDVGKV